MVQLCNKILYNLLFKNEADLTQWKDVQSILSGKLHNGMSREMCREREKKWNKTVISDRLMAAMY